MVIQWVFLNVSHYSGKIRDLKDQKVIKITEIVNEIRDVIKKKNSLDLHIYKC